MIDRRAALAAVVAIAAGCGSAARHPPPAPVPPRDGRDAETAAPVTERTPIVPPRVALAAGWMPLRSTGADRFRQTHPTFDGRGVLIGILDTGLDPHAPGLQQTSTGRPKVLDVRDFSAEGRVPLAPVDRRGDSLVIGEFQVGGAGRLAAIAVGGNPWYGGLVREAAFGPVPAGDLNGDGDNLDTIAAVVVRGLSGWLAYLDLDGDGSLSDETPLEDYLVSRQSFTFARTEGTRGRGPVGAVLNLTEADDGRPVLDIVVDNSGHGTHVAGVAAGFGIGGQPELDGVAPGAQILALKISNNARGAVSVSGAMVAAMDYAAAFARQRDLPLILNLSFGVGNAREGRAVIDSAIDAFLVRHPEVFLAISAGNDGPGLSTVGIPGSAALAVSVGALVPGSFLRLPQAGVPPAADLLATFSARGGEVAKPDLVAPGIAYSAVPAWDVGNEVKGGTSFAAPQVAGLAALLVSAAVQDIRPWTAGSIRRALLASATPPVGASPLGAGAGVPNAERAWRHLIARPRSPAGTVVPRSVPMGGNHSTGSAAFRRDGLAGPGDTVQVFAIRSVGESGGPSWYALKSEVPWIEAPERVVVVGDSATVRLRYRPSAFGSDNLVVGRVVGWAAGDSGSPAVTLVNSIAFPHDLAEAPLERRRRKLDAGRIERHFVRVPEGVGGLEVSIELADGYGAAELYLFEPSGQPARSDTTPALQIGGQHEPRGAAQVRADDLMPGVYEIVVAASSAAACTYSLRAAISPIAQRLTRQGSQLVVAAGGAPVSGRVVGASHTWSLARSGSTPWRMEVALPRWAERVEVDVEVPVADWERFTDLGMTVFTETGKRIVADPLHYPFGRTRFAAPPVASVVLELFPALALAHDRDAWNAEVTIRALARSPVALSAAGGSGALVVAVDDLVPPSGWSPVVETVAVPSTGPASIRWTPLSRAAGVTDWR